MCFCFVLLLLLFFHKNSHSQIISKTATGLVNSTINHPNKVDVQEGQKTSRPPCCMDSLTPVACRRLLRLNDTAFERRCDSDVEFRLIQCCSTCNKSPHTAPYDSIAPQLVASNCFDRYGEEFCKRYTSALDVWTLKQWACAGYSPYMAFRACRRTCGFCDVLRVHYTLRNAEDACKNVEEKTELSS